VGRYALDLGKLPQGVRVEVLVLAKIAHLDTQQVLNTPCNIVAFQDLWRSVHCAFKRAGVFVKLLGQADHDKNRYAWGKGRAIDDCTVALDDALALKLLHTSQAC